MFGHLVRIHHLFGPKTRPQPAQVVTTSTNERYSCALFIDPDFNAVVDPAHVPSCCSADNPPAFEPVTCGDYIMAKFGSTLKVAPTTVAAAS
jgi:isopenicillin N synthase-like dioxygenase